MSNTEEMETKIKVFSLQSPSSLMIRRAGFEAESLIVVTDNIDKFVEDMTKQHGSTFRLIDIKFAAATKNLDSTQKRTDVNYSALIVYEV